MCTHIKNHQQRTPLSMNRITTMNTFVDVYNHQLRTSLLMYRITNIEHLCQCIESPTKETFVDFHQHIQCSSPVTTCQQICSPDRFQDFAAFEISSETLLSSREHPSSPPQSPTVLSFLSSNLEKKQILILQTTTSLSPFSN